ncbi:MAG: hypothetical protein KZQ73_00325 [Candidatus Thiodiazotropha sp. (ex Semelilucina semeliformis)]|nr:hypothetical protein [Candidatus Thiodiazotropha sp. (ex Semelilucina semeliformis)]
MTSNDYTLLEAQTREAIDRKLTDADWVIQDKKRINLYESLGVAVPVMDTDIRPLECVMFIHDVTEAKRRKYLMKPEGVLKCKSQAYYEQMKGHGTRIISRDELHIITPDAPGKSRFVLVDCVGACESGANDQNQTNSNYNTAYLRAD